MRKDRSLCALGAAAVMLGMAGAAPAALVVNGGFETGDFTGWTVTGESGVNAGSFEGTYAAWFGEVGGIGTLVQDVPTTPGADYTLSFVLKNWGGPPNQASVTIDGVLTFLIVNSAEFDWTPFAFDFTATGDPTTIEFGFRQDPAWWSLDNVEVTPVPEPTSLALVGVATGLLMARRRAS